MIEIKEIIIRLLVATVLGGLVGLERERKDWAAGLRTHMLVCLGSCLVIIVSAFGFHDILNTPNVMLDPSRIAAQVISGIGFLGAGTILFLRQEVVRGLTTAAGLWTVAAIGLAVGSGMYIPAAVTTLIVLIILALLKPFKQIIFSTDRRISIKLDNRRNLLNEVLDSLSAEEGIQQISIDYDKDSEEDTLHVYFHRAPAKKDLILLMDKLKQMDGVRKVAVRGSR
jgi:putative Mg2+ transporter-C (MgtC) family protein